MGANLFQVDAFTSEPFAGNPAAVCLLEGQDAAWMQLMAQEMNLSETAFLDKEEDGFALRWFTPATEVALCGHATLASAHVLWEIGLLEAGQPARFHTRSGLLVAEQKGELIEMDFPALFEEPSSVPEGLIAALGLVPRYTGRLGQKVLIEVEAEETVRQLQPDFGALRGMPGRGVMVTARSESEEYDFVSRYFAPWVGIDEDPVTGSAHCCLGPYWGKRLGKEQMTAYQASARGGVVHVRLGDERVFLGGQAVTVCAGELMV